jgi:hypothetical protein
MVIPTQIRWRTERSLSFHTLVAFPEGHQPQEFYQEPAGALADRTGHERHDHVPSLRTCPQASTTGPSGASNPAIASQTMTRPTVGMTS